MECSGAKIGACTKKLCMDGTNDCNICDIRGESTCQIKLEEPVSEAPEPEVCTAEGKECCQFPGQQCARAEYNKGMHTCCDGMECLGAEIGACTVKDCMDGTNDCNRCDIRGESTCQLKSEEPVNTSYLSNGFKKRDPREAPEQEVCKAEGKECCQFPGKQCYRAEYDKGMHTCCDGMECFGGEIDICTEEGTACNIIGESTCQPKPEEPVTEAPEQEVCKAEGKECCQFPGQQCALAEYEKGMHICCDGMFCSGGKIESCTLMECSDETSVCNNCEITGESTCQPKPEEP